MPSQRHPLYPVRINLGVSQAVADEIDAAVIEYGVARGELVRRAFVRGWTRELESLRRAARTATQDATASASPEAVSTGSQSAK